MSPDPDLDSDLDPAPDPDTDQKWIDEQRKELDDGKAPEATSDPAPYGTAPSVNVEGGLSSAKNVAGMVGASPGAESRSPSTTSSATEERAVPEDAAGSSDDEL